MKSTQIIEDQIKTYRENFLKHKDSPLGTYQNNRETQHLRFERIIRPFKDILTESVSIHDVGCGVCDLHQYLTSLAIKHDYSGTEVLDEMIDYARQKFPGIKLYKRDILENKPSEKYDIVVFSGGLYLPGSIAHDEWSKFVYNMINRMYELCSIGISFNLLSTYNTYQDKHLFYIDPRDMFDYCSRNLSRFVMLDSAYPLYEWTISVFKPEFMARQYSDPAFQKYLK
jgi:hypothetical protein